LLRAARVTVFATDFRQRGGTMHRLSLLIGVLVATACGSSSTTPSSTVNTFHAEDFPEDFEGWCGISAIFYLPDDDVVNPFL
jgi:hypothetical protein